MEHYDEIHYDEIYSRAKSIKGDAFTLILVNQYTVICHINWVNIQ